MVLTATSASAALIYATKSLATPYGTLLSGANRTGGDGTISGNARMWDYAVEARIGGSQSVESIKATWTGGASMRNGASFSVTAGRDSASASASSSWSYVSQRKYWNNTNGVRIATYSSNMVAVPRLDYRPGTIALQNTAYVKFRGDARNWQVTAAL